MPRPPATIEQAVGLAEELRATLGELRAHERALEQDVVELTQMLQAAEKHAAEVQNLYVATYQLHASLELKAVRRAICEIAINLVGAARYALYERDPERDAIDITARSDDYLGGAPEIDAALADGVMRVGGEVAAVVPLTIEGGVLGALVIESLLPQKGALAAEDKELLDVLAAHAASALLAARMFHERTRKLRTLEGLMQLLRTP